MAVVFVTGATGFIGSELTALLAKNGHTVLALVRSREKWNRVTTGLTAEEKERCIALMGDMRSERLGLSTTDYHQVLGADIIIHAGVPMDISLGESVAREVILQGTRHLIEVARAVHQQNQLQKLIHIVGYMSPFDDASGQLDTDVLAESERFKHAGGYETYKFLSDLLLRQEAFRGDLPLFVVNPSTVVGPRQTGSTEQTDGLGLIVNALRKGKFPVLPGGKEWWLPLLSVDDLAALIVGIVESESLGHRTYYALNGRDTTPSFPELIQLIASELRMKPPKMRVPLTLLKSLLHAGGSRLLGVPENSMDFIIKKELPLGPFQQIKLQKGIEAYEVAAYLPDVVADLDYRLSKGGSRMPHGFQRKRLGKLAAYHKNGKGNRWVFLHGLFSDMSDLVPLAEHLGEDEVWLLDLPGFGRSPYHQTKDMDGCIRAVVEAIEEVPSPIHLAGHSFGGYLASEIAKRVPKKIEKLYLLQPPLHAPDYPALYKWIGKSPAALGRFLQRYGSMRLNKLLLEQGVFQTTEEIPSHYLDKVQGQLESPRMRLTQAEVLAFFMNHYQGMTIPLPQTHSVSLLWGSRDRMYHLARETEESFRQSGVNVKRLDLAHHFPISHPEVTAEILMAMKP